MVNTDVELDDMRMSAVGEAMNQMMGSAATSLSTLLKKDISISPPRLTKINLATDSLKGYFNEHEEIVNISFRMEVGDFLKSEIMQLMPIPFAKGLVQDLHTLSTSSYESESDQDKIESELESARPEKTEVQKPVQITQAQKDMSIKEPKTVRDTGTETRVTVKPVQFQSFEEEQVPAASASIDLILDVPLEITVELGRTNKTIKEILEISPGTIIELDKMSGEPMDILVNGKLVAKGEVVVIDENFGVRITEIIDSIERVKSLQ